MKVFVSKFVLEANENIPLKSDLRHTDICYDNECVKRMQIEQICNENGIEVIPGICADAASTGVMKKAAFDYIASILLNTLQQHIHEIDGIYLHLHGASKVEKIGSGDHYLLKEIRKMTGPYLPIAITCDPHGNLNQTYVEQSTIIRSYRQSPHTDIKETIEYVFRNLIDIMSVRKNITPVYRKLPLLLGGEQSVSTDEPVASINLYMDDLEKDPRLMSISWHVGYIRHDTANAGCGIVVVPAENTYREYAETVAEDLAQFIMDKRHEFHYTGLTAEPDKALQMALDAPKGPIFLTDSGDNVTSGSLGANTFILKQVLALGNTGNKTFLFAAINDVNMYNQLDKVPIGTEVEISLGLAYDTLSAQVPLKVKVKAKGRQRQTCIFGEEGDFGGCITVSVRNTMIDIIVTDTNHPFVEKHQFQAAKVDWGNYDIVIVKIGYAFPELKKQGALCIMSLTEGATLQNTAALSFKQIHRPMFPIDGF
ncbi:M81 family metallopeptidase [Enterococcus casseliflavus]|uniref:M81 family metallopeptidase n=1 Tax=Enterococcus casseliflavus TaxID=37734 RepID=UPI001E34E0B7|nr:M81 family metallopeptidase [Enterococcus casseliflavus]MCD4962556.1 M81 family metallopeptidase [Enterococcus casseliflavus]